MRRIILIELFLLFFLLPNLYGATKSEPAPHRAVTAGSTAGVNH
jgi:hypothetical protein